MIVETYMNIYTVNKYPITFMLRYSSVKLHIFIHEHVFIRYYTQTHLYIDVHVFTQFFHYRQDATQSQF